MLKIGLDGTSLSLGGKGLSRYIREFLHALKEVNPPHEFYIFLNSKNKLPPLPAHSKFRYIPLSFSSSFIFEQILLPSLSKKYNLHLLHTPLDRLPLAGTPPIAMYLFEIPDYRIKLSRREPFSFYEKISQKLITLFFPRSLRKASKILVSSKATQKDLETLYHVNPQKIKVVYPAANELFKPAASDEISTIRERLKTPEGYILHFSSDDPRDNTETVLKTYARLAASLSKAPPLVIGGTIKAKQKTFFSLCRALNILPLTQFAGYKEGTELVQLYQGARVYFDPSLFEGYGFQVAEAMSCGLPVVASNVSSIPELAGNAGILAPPHDIPAFTEALSRILLDKPLALALSEKSLAESKRFSWIENIRETLKIYDEIL